MTASATSTLGLRSSGRLAGRFDVPVEGRRRTIPLLWSGVMALRRVG
jgi:hypothetical protein